MGLDETINKLEWNLEFKLKYIQNLVVPKFVQ